MKFTGGGGWCTVGGSRSDLTNILALATFLQSILYLIGAREPFWSALYNAAIALQPLVPHPDIALVERMLLNSLSMPFIF